MDAPNAEGVRLDKWLWATRVYRTRSLAIAACQAGHVKLEGQRVKPSRSVRVGETYEARVGEITRRVQVAGLLDRRVGPKVVAAYLTDLTPPEEYARRSEREAGPALYRPKGTGRPTKRDRRLLEQMGWSPPRTS